MKYRIWFKGQIGIESPRPDETWPTREAAEAAIREIEENVPALKGTLEVVEAQQP